MVSRKDHAPFKAKACSRQHHIPKIVGDRAQWVGLEHVPYAGRFPPGLLCIVAGDELHLLGQWQIGPIYTIGGVAVVGTQQVIEYLSLDLRNLRDAAVHGAKSVLNVL